MRKHSALSILIFLAINGCALNQSSTSLSPRFNHVFLNVKDLEETKTFYQKAFDVQVFDEIKSLKSTDSNGKSSINVVHIVLLRFQNQGFNLEIAARPDFAADNNNANYTHLGIDVGDIELASKKLIDAGAQLLRPVTLVEANDIKAKTAFFIGPNGETLELMQVLEGEF